ncbi:MAG: hypothetical protein M1822_008773 [Bathelium mastoideum]|nr:MAG: hypothetical protein M1822_008773 [Bathelium mastoideum]
MSDQSSTTNQSSPPPAPAGNSTAPAQPPTSAAPGVASQSPATSQSSQTPVVPYPYTELKAHTAKCEGCDKKNKGVGWQCSKCIVKFCQACVESRGEAALRHWHPPCFRQPEEGTKARRKRKRTRDITDDGSKDTKAGPSKAPKIEQPTATAKPAETSEVESEESHRVSGVFHQMPATEPLSNNVAELSQAPDLQQATQTDPAVIHSKAPSSDDPKDSGKQPEHRPSTSGSSLSDLISSVLNERYGSTPTGDQLHFTNQANNVTASDNRVSAYPSSSDPQTSQTLTSTGTEQATATNHNSGEAFIPASSVSRPPKDQPIPFFDGTTELLNNPEGYSTVIVSAGIVGLCVAYQLSKERYETGHHQGIIVLEHSPSENSDMTPGRLVASNKFTRNQTYMDLGRRSLRIWKRLCGSEEVATKVGYTPKQSEIRPDWLAAEIPAEEIRKGFEAGGLHTLNPAHMALWLRNECRRYGVQFIRCLRVLDITDDHRGVVTGIKYQTRSIDAEWHVLCRSVIFALGESTESVLKDIYGHNNNLKLDLVHEAHDWMILKDSWPKPQPRIFLADNIVRFPMDIVNRDDGTFWVGGAVGKFARETDNQRPNEERLKTMRRCTETYLRGPPTTNRADYGVFDAKVLKKGRNFYTATKTGIPIISKLPISFCDPYRVYTEEDAKRSGLFFCAGYGQEGLALGMGIAELMVCLIDNQIPEDIAAPFDVAQHLEAAFV